MFEVLEPYRNEKIRLNKKKAKSELSKRKYAQAVKNKRGINKRLASLFRAIDDYNKHETAEFVKFYDELRTIYD